MPVTSKSRTTTRGGTKQGKRARLVERRLPTDLPPTHPGEMLREEFLVPLGITQTAFAQRLGVSFPRLNEIINARRGVTPDTALRLARVTGMSADFWLGLQQDWDLWHALRSAKAREIARLKPLAVGAKRGSREKFLAAMAHVPDVEPEPHDRLPAELKPNRPSSPAMPRRATPSRKRAK